MTARSWVLGSLGALMVVALPQGKGIERVAWLGGCWETRSLRRTVEEHWMAPRAHSMISLGRTVRGDSVVEYELVVLREQGTQLAYEAHPSGQAVAVFLSIDLSDSTVIFENAQHDFPQRVGYQRRGADSLLAWVEGTAGGRSRRIEFPYGRVRCPGQ